MLEELRKVVRSYGSAVLGFSGGVDSTLLAAVCQKELDGRFLAVTSLSDTFPYRERESMMRLVDELGLNHRTIRTRELSTESFAKNDSKRCYHCKSMLYGELMAIAKNEGYAVVLDGTNLDDMKAGEDERPGMLAMRTLGVKAPLADVGMTKQDVRDASKRLGLPTWNKPALACISSRIPRGTRITKEILDKVNKAEEVLVGLGFSDVRVRYHGQKARIEVPKADVERLKATEFKLEGFSEVEIDERGYVPAGRQSEMT